MDAITITGWPVVEVDFLSPASDAQVQAWLQSMNDLLSRQERFIVVVNARPNSQFSPEGRKAFGLWFKQEREAMAEYCAGVVRVVESAEQGERIVSPAMQQAMPFPMVAMLSADEARQWAGLRLEKALEGKSCHG